MMTKWFYLHDVSVSVSPLFSGETTSICIKLQCKMEEQRNTLGLYSSTSIQSEKNPKQIISVLEKRIHKFVVSNYFKYLN